MGLRIESCGDDTYKIYDTIGGGYWYDNPLPRKNIVAMLAEDQLRRAKEEVIKLAMTFPDGYYTKSERTTHKGPNTACDFYDWLLKATKENANAVNKKFKSIAKEYGIKI